MTGGLPLSLFEPDRNAGLEAVLPQLATNMTIQPSQLHALVTAERVSSVFSVVGACFIIATFLSDRSFRKPINRLVFFAAWGNLFANVATLISRSGIVLGVRTPLCQFQAFLIHW